MFGVLCAEAGVGKGLVIDEIAGVLKHKKMLKVANLQDTKAELEDITGPLPLTNKNKNQRMDNMLIPTAPDCVTYEALCKVLANSSRPLWFPTGKQTSSGKEIMTPSFHSSAFFLLDELASLFPANHKESDKNHVFMNQCYDCRDEYEYETKNQGTSLIRRPCISILAGTTPHFLKRIFSSAILQEGFASRTLFLVENKGRFRHYNPPSHTAEQMKVHEEIVDWCKSISSIQGEVKWTDEAMAFNKNWFEVEYEKGFPNPHPNLRPYYQRAGMTHAKLCMAIHFGESRDMTIGIDVARRGLELQQSWEMNMHKAIGMEVKNPLSEVTDAIESYIGANGACVTKKTLITTFYDAFPSDPWKDIDMVIRQLKDKGKIVDDPSGKANSYRRI